MRKKRNLVPPPVETLAERLQRAWSRETSADPTGWSHENPAWGQCAVTALIVQDHFGGRLRRSSVDGISHYFNELSNGECVDLTREQFDADSAVTEPEDRTRHYVLSFPETRQRYERLKTQLHRETRERVRHG